MLLTGAQPHPSKCREHVCRLFKFDHFSGVACCRSSPPLPSHPSVLFPLACLSPNPPAPPKTEAQLRQIFPWLRTVRTPVQKQLPNQSGNGPILVQRKCRWYRFSTDSQPICNRFATVFQPIFNRAPRPQPICNRFSTARQTRNRFSTVFQPFFNRFSTVFQPIFNRLRNRFSTVF